MSAPRALSEADRPQVWARLSERGIRDKCPMCHNGKLELSPWLLGKPLLETLAQFGRSGELYYLPVVTLICQNCGFVSEHALPPLGLAHMAEQKAEEAEAGIGKSAGVRPADDMGKSRGVRRD